MPLTHHPDTINLSHPGRPLPDWLRYHSLVEHMTHAFKLSEDTYLIHIVSLDPVYQPCSIELVRRRNHDGLHFMQPDRLPEEAAVLYNYIATLFAHLVHGPENVIE